MQLLRLLGTPSEPASWLLTMLHTLLKLRGSCTTPPVVLKIGTTAKQACPSLTPYVWYSLVSSCPYLASTDWAQRHRHIRLPAPRKSNQADWCWELGWFHLLCAGCHCKHSQLISLWIWVALKYYPEIVWFLWQAGRTRRIFIASPFFFFLWTNYFSE